MIKSAAGKQGNWY